MTSLVPAPEHRFAAVSGVRLHFVESALPGAHSSVVLLHGFPECWYSWRYQIPALAAAGFRVVAPDLRGYNRSDKPPRVADYRIERLVEDVVGLVRQTCGGRCHLVGHDWGGAIAWYVAMWHPEVVDRLVILNAPHPAAYLRELRRGWSQRLRSWYAAFFQLPWLPESVLRFNDFAWLKWMLRHEPARPGAFTEADLDRYAEAWSRPGAMRAGLNYYRAAVRRGLGRMRDDVRRIDRPTMIVWGMRDHYLVPALIEGLESWVADVRIEHLDRATHWVQHDEPERVNELLSAFLSPDANKPAGVLPMVAR